MKLHRITIRDHERIAITYFVCEIPDADMGPNLHDAIVAKCKKTADKMRSKTFENQKFEILFGSAVLIHNITGERILL